MMGPAWGPFITLSTITVLEGPDRGRPIYGNYHVYPLESRRVWGLGGFRVEELLGFRRVKDLGLGV